MSKKILTIFLGLFLLGILSISCSNSDKLDPRGIAVYKGTYSGAGVVQEGSSGSMLLSSLTITINANGSINWNETPVDGEPISREIPNAIGTGANYYYSEKTTDRSSEVKFSFSAAGNCTVIAIHQLLPDQSPIKITYNLNRTK